ncbi:uncharacterized protein LOC130743920 [Lotus japonicus]|uniref:uncharacterized protein LOC130743920 n=1 Tax=Lotus japonicus TaxID=34305 RepID=UPI0025834741|nr:uncharacterized protein LOC130743920 [Lotus japonicus]
MVYDAFDPQFRMHPIQQIEESPNKDAQEIYGFNPSPIDLFRTTHQHKDGTFVDKKLEHVDGAYVREMEDRTQRASEQNLPPPNELDVWRDVAGVKKDRIYGLGLESTVINKQYHGSCSSSTEWVRRSEFDQLRNTMEETQRMVKQMMEEMMQQPPMQTPNQEELETEESESEEDLGGFP